MQEQRQRQYSGRSGCAFTPAFGREERRFRGGLVERPKAEALGYLEGVQR
jgi:hypothetical protein